MNDDDWVVAPLPAPRMIDHSRDMIKRSWFWLHEFPMLPVDAPLVLMEEAILADRPPIQRMYATVNLVVNRQQFQILGIRQCPDEAKAARPEVLRLCIIKSLCAERISPNPFLSARRPTNRYLYPS